MKNKMSVFTLSCGCRYYLTHPHKFFKDVYWSIRNFIHRGRYGFAYSDIWCMDEYLLDVIPLMLRYLGEHSCGYPGVEPFETFEKYQRFLFQLAEKFERCLQDDDFDSENEYAEEFHKMAEEHMKYQLDTGKQKEKSVKEKILVDNYFNKMESLTKENDKRILEAYTELAKNHHILWD